MLRCKQPRMGRLRLSMQQSLLHAVILSVNVLHVTRLQQRTHLTGGNQVISVTGGLQSPVAIGQAPVCVIVCLKQHLIDSISQHNQLSQGHIIVPILGQRGGGTKPCMYVYQSRTNWLFTQVVANCVSLRRPEWPLQCCLSSCTLC